MSKSVVLLLLFFVGSAVALLIPIGELWLDQPAGQKHSESTVTPSKTSDSAFKIPVAENAVSSASWANEIAERLRLQLAEHQYSRAVNTINENYQKAEVADLARFKSIILTHAATLAGTEKLQSTATLLEAYTQQFDDLDAWRMLASAYVRLEQWPNALQILKRTTSLENETTRYMDSLRALDSVASRVAAELKQQQDPQGIMTLYRELFELFPQHARFQLSFGKALANIGDTDLARQQFESLLYEPDIQFLAQQEIDAMDALAKRQHKDSEPVIRPTLAIANQIVVPLIRAGNSLIVESNIEGQPARLLLDTGASITALSSALIEQLNLNPTGQSIRLSTANGVKDARLFSADELNFGRATFTNIVVAEIELPNSSQISGLLGTDILRRMSDRYSYVIDDERDALIFKPK